jgi:hypothetical protein
LRLAGSIMRPAYQYCRHDLPVRPGFLMLLMAFADARAGKAAEARSVRDAAGHEGGTRRTRRPNRGRRGPAWWGRLGIADTEVISQGGGEDYLASPHRGQPPNKYRRSGLTASWGGTQSRSAVPRGVGGRTRGFHYEVDGKDAVAGESPHGGGTATRGAIAGTKQAFAATAPGHVRCHPGKELSHVEFHQTVLVGGGRRHRD